MEKKECFIIKVHEIIGAGVDTMQLAIRNCRKGAE